MVYFIFALVGVACGALAMFVALDAKRKRVYKLKVEQDAKAQEHQRNVDNLRIREEQFALDMQHKMESLASEVQQQKESLSRQLQDRLEKLRVYEADLNAQAAKINQAQQQFEKRVVTCKELEDENAIVKRDLRNLAVSMRKLELDSDLQLQLQRALDQKVQEVGSRYLRDSVKWIGDSLNANNYVNCRQRIQDMIERLRGIGFEIAAAEEAAYIADLRAEYEHLVRAALEREEQARIKAQIREEQKVEREIQREQERIERERQILEVALAKALAEAHDQHSAEIQSLKARLAEAEAKERAISQAQLTKAGFIYVISNIGSFGDGIYKVGMTRRLEPMDRIRELGDASVPFPFDVHMMISCENAPTLENAIHRTLVKQQINKMNPRKEFFKTDIQAIVDIVKQHHGEVEYVADAEALQYRQSLSMSDEDLEFIEHVFEEADEDRPAFDEDAAQQVLSSI